MYKKITFTLLLLFFNLIFCQNNNKNSKSDSTYFYTKAALYNKNNKIYDKAFENVNKSILYAQKEKNNVALANGYCTLATIYIDLEKYDLAIENLIRSISTLSDQNPSSQLALCYYNLGLCYMKKENFSRAESYFGKANLIYESLSLKKTVTMVNLQKGILYNDLGKEDLAEKVFTAIYRLPDNKNTIKSKAEALYYLGDLQAKKDVYHVAQDYYIRAYEYSLKSKDRQQQLKISKKLSTIFEKLKLTEESLKFLKIYSNIKDSLYIVSQKNILKSGPDQYRINEIIKSMDKMDKEKKEQEKASKFSKLINIMSIALITILSLLSLSLYKNNIIRNKSNELLRDKNSELEIARERTEKASKARAEFLSTVSHELRTPLNAINGISHILLEDDPKQSQIEYLNSLKFSGNYLLTYINEILEINRIESNNIELESINFEIRKLLKNIQNSLKELASKNNDDFRLKISEDIPEYLVGDPTKLSQIFINLINNALKFTQNGEVTIIANLINQDSKLCSIKFEIADTGIGIPLDKQETIFDSFSQGSVEINRKYGGTGLGLTIVKRLISLMGGEIKVHSIVGEGTTFSFDLDFTIGEEEEINKDNYIIDEKIFIDKRILLVEDNKINQMITKKILEKKLMKCELCETGEESIELVKDNDYDLVLMDVHLPGINGTIATQSIREFDKNIPIIALTAISLDENREMLLSFGMNDVITKPFNPDVFYKIIEQNLLINSDTE
jgi:signal transduction histidine kinase/CheY-like chemotaxis protein